MENTVIQKERERERPDISKSSREDQHFESALQET